MLDIFIRALFFIVGLINFTPLTGVLGQAKLQALYGINTASPDLLLLLQHRAILFGIVGGMLLLASIRRSFRITAAIAGGISMVGFLLLAKLGDPSLGAINAQLTRVFTIDVVAIILLTLAVAGHFWQEKKVVENTV